MPTAATWDHPRSRGENFFLEIPGKGHFGSSPLARGKPPGRRAFVCAPRIIPARAGKTSGFAVRTSAHTDHPRSRGENGLAQLVGLPPEGPSPLARGKPNLTAFRNGQGGIIPARAGKTARVPYLAPPPPDHPRVSGENRARYGSAGPNHGSSPRERGKRAGEPFEVAFEGIIPA